MQRSQTGLPGKTGLRGKGETGKGEVEDKRVEEHCKEKEEDKVKDYIRKHYCLHILNNKKKSTREAGREKRTKD